MIRKIFDKVYAIMEASFPETEFRPMEEQYALFADPAYRIFLPAAGRGKSRDFLPYGIFPEVLYIEHFAVDGRLRGGGIGAAMIGELKALCDKPICLEVEPPEKRNGKKDASASMRETDFFPQSVSVYAAAHLGRSRCYTAAYNDRRRIYR